MTAIKTTSGSKRAAGKAAATRPKQSNNLSSTQSPRTTHSGAELLKNAADVVDEQLARYRSMRNFSVTDEPSGGHEDAGTHGASLPFCIQKHAASHLHYDFRLGWNGVLKSWAIAKGPSYVTADKRLAVQVEDHPIDYGGFEGIIPKGQYGGGTVMLWDQGTWKPQPGHENVDAGLRDGSLKFLLYGTKLHGKWTLIRMGGKAAQERKPNWLLIKEHDEFERSSNDSCVTEAEPNSVATGRTMEEIAASEDHVWNSKDTAASEGRAWYRKQRATSLSSKPRPPELQATTAKDKPRPAHPSATTIALSRAMLSTLRTLPSENQPAFLKPQLALETAAPPEGPGWLHELKLDGYRIQARKVGAKVAMLTRSGLDWTHRIPAVASAVARLAASSVTLDGEVVVLRADGTTNFADLQASFQEGAINPLTYFCFDLLHLEGRDVRGLDLRARKDLLAAVLDTGDGDTVRLSEHLESNGNAMFRQACELHAEGVVSKLATAPYRAGRSGDWLKSKCLREQEFVIGGFTLPSNGTHGIGALLLGYYTADQLIYAGRTGTGFTQKTHRMMRDRLDALREGKSAFAGVPAAARRGVVWVRPEAIAQVRFATWTADNLVRQAAFLGLREDKPVREVRREGLEIAPRPKQLREPHSAPAEKSVAHRTGSRGGIAARSRAPRRDVPDSDHADSTPQERQPTPVPASIKRPAKQRASASGGVHAPVRLTHPEKILDLRSGVTKQMLADFYWAVSECMLPAVAGRPLSLVRCPEGSGKPCFYQKHMNHMLPTGVTAVDVPDKKTGKLEPYITLSSREALAGLAQMGVLEVHPWASRNDDLEHPDRLVFDLDPDEALEWEIVTSAAVKIRQRLKSIQLESFLKTTGGKGLHIVVPIQPHLDWPKIKAVTRAFVVEMERERPDRYLTTMTKTARKGRIYLDYLRNERGATAVAPYSPRAREGMPVSVPLAWSELKSHEQPRFYVADFATWRHRLDKDPWRQIDTIQQQLDL